MSMTITRNPRYLLHEVFLSMYSSFLFVWSKESRPFAWSTRYLYFWHPHAVSLSRIDFLVFYLELFLFLAVAIFLCLRLFRRFSLARVLLRAIAGVVAIAGFPAVCVYRQGLPLFFFDVEFVLAAVCFLLWADRKWPVPAPLSVFLLILHYAFWSFFGAGIHLAGWRWTWGIWDYAWFVYPALGFTYTLVWAAYFRHSRANEQSSRPAIVK